MAAAQGWTVTWVAVASGAVRQLVLDESWPVEGSKAHEDAELAPEQGATMALRAAGSVGDGIGRKIRQT